MTGRRQPLGAKVWGRTRRWWTTPGKASKRRSARRARWRAKQEIREQQEEVNHD